MATITYLVLPKLGPNDPNQMAQHPVDKPGPAPWWVWQHRDENGFAWDGREWAPASPGWSHINNDIIFAYGRRYTGRQQLDGFINIVAACNPDKGHVLIVVRPARTKAIELEGLHHDTTIWSVDALMSEEDPFKLDGLLDILPWEIPTDSTIYRATAWERIMADDTP